MNQENNPLMIMDNSESRYREYEELLLRRDQLFRECGSIMTAYTKEFGDLITANFELKIECIKKKKIMSYCCRRMNRGLAIDMTRLQTEIDQEMLLYYTQLKAMLDDIENAKNAGTISEFRLSRAKAAEAIRAGIVSVDHIECLKPDAHVEEGSSLVLKGKGKAVLREVGGESKKGRIWIVIERFV